VVWVGRIVAVPGYAAEVAFFVHHLAVFVGCFVGIQVDGLLANRAGELLFAKSVGFHICLISPYGKSVYHQCYIPYKTMFDVGLRDPVWTIGAIDSYG